MADELKETLRAASGEVHAGFPIQNAPTVTASQGTTTTLNDADDATGSKVTATYGGDTADGEYREQWKTGDLTYAGAISYIKIIPRVKLVVTGDPSAVGSYQPVIDGTKRGSEDALGSIVNDSQQFNTNPDTAAAWVQANFGSGGKLFGWYLKAISGSDFPAGGDSAVAWVVDWKIEVWGPAAKPSLMTMGVG